MNRATEWEVLGPMTVDAAFFTSGNALSTATDRSAIRIMGSVVEIVAEHDYAVGVDVAVQDASRHWPCSLRARISR